jgi:hypothetical protein
MASKKTDPTPQAEPAAQAVPHPEHTGSVITGELHRAVAAIEAVAARASLLAGSGVGELAQAAHNLLGDAQTALQHVKNALSKNTADQPAPQAEKEAQA